MVDAYDPQLRQLARHIARQYGIVMHDGIYAGLIGPAYESPAEARLLRTMGADAVGMSTVLETIAARALGLIRGRLQPDHQRALAGPADLAHRGDRGRAARRARYCAPDRGHRRQHRWSGNDRGAEDSRRGPTNGQLPETDRVQI